VASDARTARMSRADEVDVAVGGAVRDDDGRYRTGCAGLAQPSGAERVMRREVENADLVTADRVVARTRSAPDRFWSKLDQQLPLIGCWEWRGAVSNTGYGCFEYERNRVMSTHRYSYLQLVGAIPSGLVLDHLCRNKRCVNPDHLEPVTHAENVQRGVAARRAK
jgi:HNH endonuclease